MNMPPPGQPGQPPQGQEPQGQPGQGQNPIIQALQLLGQFVERLAQRNPQQAKAAGAALQQFVAAIKGGGGKPDEGTPQEEAGENPQQEQQEQAQQPKGAKKMGPMPMNAKRGAVQVL